MKLAWLLSVTWLAFCCASGAWLASQDYGYMAMVFGILIGLHIEWQSNEIKKGKGKHGSAGQR